MSGSPRVAVVGGGIVGAACAYACASAGMEVTLLERTPTHGGATAVATGHIVTVALSPAQLALTSFSRWLWHALGPRLPPEAGYSEVGTVWLELESRDGPVLDLFRSSLSTARVPSERWSEPRLRTEEPALTEGAAGGLFVPGDAVVRPAVAATVLRKWAREAGAEVLQDQEVVAADRGILRLREGKSLRAEHIVIAAGTATRALLPDAPVRPRRGHLVSTEPAPGLVRHQLLDAAYLRSAEAAAGDSVVFNAHPRVGGELVLGSSRDYVAEGTPPDPGTFDRILERAVELLPPLAEVKVNERWVGYRPASADNLPYIGPWPTVAGVWLATGHEGLGVTCSLATGQLIAESIAGKPPSISVAPFAPTPERLRASSGGFR